MKQRHTLIPASYLLFEKEGKLLLLRRFNTGFEDGKYSLPSGHVEEGETFKECAVREAKEEVGVEIEERDLECVHIMQRLSSVDSEERIDNFFKVNKWKGTLENKEPEKCDDLSWFEKENLPENLIEFVKKALKKMERKEFYSEEGWS